MAKSITLYLDNEDGCISLYRDNRTDKNHLADNKGAAVGVLIGMIVNELERLRKYDSLTITISKS